MKSKDESFEQLINELNIHESEDRLIIGVDFGTTFSGLAYTFTNSAKPDLIAIQDWPGLEAYKQPKVPTIISYDPEDKLSFTWGSQIHKHTKIEGIKLLLDPDQEKPLYVPAGNTKAQLKKLGKPPLDVVADYLRALYQHAMERIETKVPVEYLEMCQKQFVLSVPAVWSDKAKDLTMRAAKQAGIWPVNMIKEPEAAALYTLHVIQEKALAAGDAIVICDAGGGTVDLISYEITSLKPLQLKELVPSKGGMAGSLQLNKRFEQAVKEVVGEDQYFHLRKTKGYQEATKFFDQIVKPSFRGNPEESWYVNFPMAELEDDPTCHIKSNTWEMKSEVVKDIFQPLITDIRRMVDEQVNLVRVKRMSDNHPKAKEVKAIFLVGGFGASEYLKQCLAKVHPNIQIIQPHDAWSAIVRGAVLSQLPEEATVVSSVAQRHYGVSAWHPYEELIDRGQVKDWDASRGRWRAERMTWFIFRGEDLKRDQRILFPFYRRLAADFSESQLIFRDELIMDESVLSSPHPKEGVTKTNCRLTADLTQVDRSHFQNCKGIDGKSYVDVHYDLVVTVSSAVMKFSLEIKGKELGSVEANYE